MRRRRVAAAVISIALTVSVGAEPAQALSGCSSGAPSAIDQYCESIPTANNGPTSLGPAGTPGGITPLASTLPRPILQRLTRSRKRVILLSIPAPYRQTSSATVSGGNVGGSMPAVSPWSLIQIPLVVIGALAVALAGVALWRRRDHGGTGAPHSAA
jgi:hypothetical protein